MASLLAVLVLKPIVGAVLGALVGAFLASLAAIDSLFNYRGMLDGLLALGLCLGLAGVESLAKVGNAGGVLDDVFRTVLAMFDDYLRYRELRAASARGVAGGKSKAKEPKGTSFHAPRGYDHELKQELKKEGEEEDKAEPARQRSGSEGTGEADAQEPTQ
jgi:hypothetical protein